MCQNCTHFSPATRYVGQEGGRVGCRDRRPQASPCLPSKGDEGLTAQPGLQHFGGGTTDGAAAPCTP